jgi:hypothetical protein
VKKFANHENARKYGSHPNFFDKKYARVNGPFRGQTKLKYFTSASPTGIVKSDIKNLTCTLMLENTKTLKNLTIMIHLEYIPKIFESNSYKRK